MRDIHEPKIGLSLKKLRERIGNPKSPGLWENKVHNTLPTVARVESPANPNHFFETTHLFIKNDVGRNGLGRNTYWRKK